MTIARSVEDQGLPPFPTAPVDTADTNPILGDLPADYQVPGTSRVPMPGFGDGYGDTWWTANIFGEPVLSRRYVNGDEWGPADTPDEVVGLKGLLVAAGFLSESAAREQLLLWDESAAAAYKNAMELANRYGASVDVLLRDRAAQNAAYGGGSGGGGGGHGGGGGGRLPANEDDLKALANQVAPTIIGRRFDDAEMAQWIGSWRAVEQGNPPQADVAAESSARAQVPVEAGAHDLANTYGQFLKVIGGAG